MLHMVNIGIHTNAPILSRLHANANSEDGV